VSHPRVGEGGVAMISLAAGLLKRFGGLWPFSSDPRPFGLAVLSLDGWASRPWHRPPSRPPGWGRPPL